MRMIRKLFSEWKYIFLNCVICHIPLWFMRKFLYRILGLKVGRGSRILMNVRIYAPEKIMIGNNSWINEYCYLDGRGEIEIGSNVTIATFTKLITGSHDIDSDVFEYKDSPIQIKDNCAVFSDSVVLGGAVLESGCVISAKSLVRKGLYQANGIYGGNPAKYIRQRKSDANYTQNGFTVFR